MDSIPEEILIEIFKHLSKRDLLNLTSISKYFNSVIGNYQELFSKIDLCFKVYNPYWNCTRRYSSLVVKRFIQDLHLPIIDKIKNDVTSICIVKWNNDVKILSQLISSFKNIKKIIFKKVQFNVAPEKLENLPELLDINLEFIETDASLLNIFKYCSVKKLDYDYTPRGALDIPEVIEFLKIQRNLEDLTLSGFIVFFGGGGIGKVIFNDNSLSNVEFRLKRLTIRKSPLCPTIHFNNFLKLHTDSLKYVEIDDVENWYCTSFLTSCSNLTHLKLGKRTSKTFVPNINFCSVTWLSLEENVDINFLKYFPNIKFLHVAGLKVLPRHFEDTIGCDQVKEMIVRKSWLGGFFKFTSLEKLTLRNIKFLSPEIFRVNNQIKCVIIEDCLGVNENVVNLIHEYCKNLKTFIVK